MLVGEKESEKVSDSPKVTQLARDGGQIQPQVCLISKFSKIH